MKSFFNEATVVIVFVAIFLLSTYLTLYRPTRFAGDTMSEEYHVRRTCAYWMDSCRNPWEREPFTCETEED